MAFIRLPNVSVTPTSVRVEGALTAAVFQYEQTLRWCSEKSKHCVPLSVFPAAEERVGTNKDGWQSHSARESDFFMKTLLNLFLTEQAGSLTLYSQSIKAVQAVV